MIAYEANLRNVLYDGEHPVTAMDARSAMSAIIAVLTIAKSGVNMDMGQYNDPKQIDG